MNCDKCGRGPETPGIVLQRRNEKGIKGIWRCLECGAKIKDPVVAEIVSTIKGDSK